MLVYLLEILLKVINLTNFYPHPPSYLCPLLPSLSPPSFGSDEPPTCTAILTEGLESSLSTGNFFLEIDCYGTLLYKLLRWTFQV